MNAILTQFHFLHPYWLGLLVLLPLLLWWLARHAAASASLQRLVDKTLLPYLLDTRGRHRRWPLGLLALSGVLVSLALAGPTWQRVERPLYASRAAQVVALSLSPRMLATDVTPNRLARARYKVHDLFAANRAGQNALIAYAGDAYTVAPLTTDADALDNLLDALAPDVMPTTGDNAAAAIRRGVKLLDQGGAVEGSLVLVTDDVDSDAIAAARRAHAAGARVSVLGVGSGKGAPIKSGGGFLKNAQGDIVMARRNDAHLRALAQAGGGRYAPMQSDHSDIDALAGELRTGSANVASAHANTAQWRDFGPWLLLPLLPLAALAFRRGWVLMLVLALPLLPTPARAGMARAPAVAATVSAPATDQGNKSSSTTWGERLGALWLTPDQRAAHALTAGDAKRAQELARDPAWRGAADYRAGDYAAAAKAFARAHDNNAQYNLGNALVKQGQYQQALTAYSRALKADPGNADAAANRKAVRAWLRQQQQHKPQSSSSSAKGSGQQGQDGNAGKGAAGFSKQADSSHGTQPQSGNNAEKRGGKQASPAPASSPGSRAQVGPARAGSSTQTPRSARPAHAGSAPRDASAPDAAAAARRKAQAQQARKALHQQMDRQLERKDKGEQPYTLGAQPASAASSKHPLPQSMQRELQRVPDDPGGLLRRKFMLEYQRRHGGRDNGGSP